MSDARMGEAVLKKRENTRMLLIFLENNNEKIKYPDRQSKFIRNSFTLSFLDDYSQTVLEEQQKEEAKEKTMEYKLQDITKNKQSNIMLETSNHRQQNPPRAVAIPTAPARTVYGGSSSSGLVRITGNLLGAVVRGVGGEIYGGVKQIFADRPIPLFTPQPTPQPTPPESGDEEGSGGGIVDFLTPPESHDPEEYHMEQARQYQEDLDAQEEKKRKES